MNTPPFSQNITSQKMISVFFGKKLFLIFECLKLIQQTVLWQNCKTILNIFILKTDVKLIWNLNHFKMRPSRKENYFKYFFL